MRHLPVVGANERIVGIVSLADITRAAPKSGADPDIKKAKGSEDAPQGVAFRAGEERLRISNEGTASVDNAAAA